MYQKVMAKGFELSQKFKVLFNSELYDLMEEAPYDASALAYFKKEKKGYSGLLVISSSKRQFVASNADMNLTELGASLCRKVREDIHRWKNRRSQPNNLYQATTSADTRIPELRI